MMPALPPERIVLLVPPIRVRVGDVVVIWHSGREKIKRVAQLKDGAVYVLGDNPGHSTDSRHFGWLPNTVVTAKVLGASRHQSAGRWRRPSFL